MEDPAGSCSPLIPTRPDRRAADHGLSSVIVELKQSLVSPLDSCPLLPSSFIRSENIIVFLFFGPNVIFGLICLRVLIIKLMKRSKLLWFSCLLQLWSEGTEPEAPFYTRDTHTSPLSPLGGKRTRLWWIVIGDLTGTMASTLSADEEQVGLGTIYSGVITPFLSPHDRNSSLGPTWRYVAVCSDVCAPHRNQSAVRNGGCVAKRVFRVWNGNLVSISGALLLTLHHCQFLSGGWDERLRNRSNVCGCNTYIALTELMF